MLKISACTLISLSLMVVGSYAQQDSNTQSAQAHLVIRGVVRGSKLMPSPSPEEFAVICVSLNLEIENEGDAPALFLTDYLPRFPKIILTSDSKPISEQNILFEDYNGPSLSEEAEWRRLRSTLDHPLSPPGIVTDVAPRMSWKEDPDYVFRVPVKRRSSFIGGHSASWESLQNASPVFVRFEAQFWPLEVEKMPRPDKLKLGRKLQKRWQKVGFLQLNPVMTQPMLLNLPKDGG